MQSFNDLPKKQQTIIKFIVFLAVGFGAYLLVGSLG